MGSNSDLSLFSLNIFNFFKTLIRYPASTRLLRYYLNHMCPYRTYHFSHITLSIGNLPFLLPTHLAIIQLLNYVISYHKWT